MKASKTVSTMSEARKKDRFLCKCGTSQCRYDFCREYFPTKCFCGRKFPKENSKAWKPTYIEEPKKESTLTPQEREEYLRILGGGAPISEQVKTRYIFEREIAKELYKNVFHIVRLVLFFPAQILRTIPIIITMKLTRINIQFFLFNITGIGIGYDVGDEKKAIRYLIGSISSIFGFIGTCCCLLMIDHTYSILELIYITGFLFELSYNIQDIKNIKKYSKWIIKQ